MQSLEISQAIVDGHGIGFWLTQLPLAVQGKSHSLGLGIFPQANHCHCGKPLGNHMHVIIKGGIGFQFCPICLRHVGFQITERLLLEHQWLVNSWQPGWAIHLQLPWLQFLLASKP
jgi:hypothetical protein